MREYTVTDPEKKMDIPIIEDLFALDFDRTIADSNRLNELLFIAADMCNYDLEDLRKRELEGRGKSFNTLVELKKVVHNDSEMARIKEVFMALAKDIRGMDYKDGGFLEPHAPEFLKSISREQRMILTYGSDEEWQKWKLEAAGLADDYHVIATGCDAFGNPLPKPQLLASLYDDTEEMFVLNDVNNREHPIKAMHITIIDDKLENLRGLPEKVDGLWYIPWRSDLKEDTDKLEETKSLPARVKVLRWLSQTAMNRSRTRH